MKSIRQMWESCALLNFFKRKVVHEGFEFFEQTLMVNENKF